MTTQQIAVPYETMVRNLFNAMDSSTEALVHASIGIAGESVEVLATLVVDYQSYAAKRENQIEELGDVYFYMTAFALTLQEGALSVPRETAIYVPALAIDYLVIFSGDLLDNVKKLWVYKKSWNAIETKRLLDKCNYAYQNVLKVLNIAHEEVIVYNQTKLGKRYPAGVFVATDAVNRADKAA